MNKIYVDKQTNFIIQTDFVISEKVCKLLISSIISERVVNSFKKCFVYDVTVQENNILTFYYIGYSRSGETVLGTVSLSFEVINKEGNE